MAISLIIYPAPGANSFVSLGDAESYIEPLINYSSWSSLSDDDKARRLIFAYEKFFLLKDFVPPADLIDSCLPEAQSRLAVYSLVYGTDNIAGEQQVRKEQLGPMLTEYFKNEGLDRLGVEDFPPIVVTCLAQYGVKNPNTIGVVGAIRKTR